jgi:SAM-dependent methyltransferase
MDSKTASILKKNNQGIKLDLGGGGAPQPGFVNIDVRNLPTVDIVHNLELFPWPLPDESCSLVMASHLLEHINPMYPDARLAPLIKLLLKKKLVSEKEIKDTIGEIEPGAIFMRFMDEVWRIMKPGGQFMAAFPYAGSPGFWQDPTHINGINEHTLAYFDPFEAGGFLFKIYKPKPWKIVSSQLAPSVNGNMEILLEKRRIDKSYYV